MVKKYTDKQLMKIFNIDKKTLGRFWQIRRETIKEAEKIKKHFFEKEIRILFVSGAVRHKKDCPQEDSNSEWLLEQAMDEAKKLGAKVELIKLWDYNIQPCKGCYSTTNTQCHYKCSCYPEGTKDADDMTSILYDKISWADGIIFSTPVHNFKISSPSSLFIDRAISMDGSLEPANLKYPKDKGLNKKHSKFIELTGDDKIWGSGYLPRLTNKVAGIIVTGHEAGLSMAVSSLFLTLNQFGMIFPKEATMWATGDVTKGTYADKKSMRAEEHAKTARRLACDVFKLIKYLKGCKGYWPEYDSTHN